MRGVTWIEVLIIIAILGILAAVIVPRVLGW
jgi:Tfp pilus assembly protein FimT